MTNEADEVVDPEMLTTITKRLGAIADQVQESNADTERMPTTPVPVEIQLSNEDLNVALSLDISLPDATGNLLSDAAAAEGLAQEKVRQLLAADLSALTWQTTLLHVHYDEA